MSSSGLRFSFVPPQVWNRSLETSHIYASTQFDGYSIGLSYVRRHERPTASADRAILGLLLFCYYNSMSHSCTAYHSTKRAYSNATRVGGPRSLGSRIRLLPKDPRNEKLHDVLHPCEA